MLNWSIHDGKSKNLISIVEDLINPFKDKSYIVSMDRFYNSIDVIQYLSRTKVGAYGAVMKNRAKMTENMQNEINALEKHETLFYVSSDHNILFTIWRATQKSFIFCQISVKIYEEK